MPTPDYKQMVKDVAGELGVDWTRGPSWNHTRWEIIEAIHHLREIMRSDTATYGEGYQLGELDGVRKGEARGRVQRSGEIARNLDLWAEAFDKRAARSKPDRQQELRHRAEAYRAAANQIRTGEI